MSMSLTDAKLYVARIYATTANTTELNAAADSIKATAAAWTKKHLWSWLLQDTTQTFAVAACSMDGSPTPTAVLTTSTTDGFKNVLVGMTVTGSGIPASTTVASIESNTSITLSNTVSSDITTISVTFGGTIPIIAGTAAYKLPSKFWRPKTARLTTNPRPLTFIHRHLYDQVVWDQSGNATPTHYTIGRNSVDFDAAGTQQDYVELIGTPGAADVLLLKYFRYIDGAASTIDVPDEFLYDFLDSARIHYLNAKNSADNRLPGLVRDMRERLASAIATDMGIAGEDDMERIIPQVEWNTGPSTDDLAIWGLY